MQPIISGADMRDTAGNRIEAHEGGIIQEGGTFYLYGTDRSQNNHWFYAINMYSSTDLVHWTFRNRILSPASHADLNDRVVERPKIVRCPSTGKYVMWWHHETSNYGLAEVGHATCDTIDGNYAFGGHWRPRGADSRDMGLFQDTDGKAYLICSVYGNSQSAIYRLSDDYTDCPTDAIYQSGGGINGEGHSIVKVGGTYFWFKSGYGGWPPNDNYYSTATSLAGPWTNRGNFVPSGSVSFYSQNYNTMTVTGTSGTTIFFMGDRWHPNAHSQDRTLWLPLTISGTTASIVWYDAWNIDTVTGTWNAGSNIIPNGTYKIISRSSGKAMRATGSGNGSAVEQVTYTGASDQKWTITHLGSSQGSYRIANVQSGRVLDVNGNSTANGGWIDIYDNNGGNNQKWRICPTDSGHYCLLSASSRMVIDVPGGSASEGTDLVQWDRSGGNNQEWALVPVDHSNLPDYPANLVATIPNGETGKVQLDWTPVPGATSYQVKSSTSSEGPFAPVGAPVITPSYTLTAPAGVPVYYTVTAKNWFGEGGDAEVVCFSPAALRARYALEGSFTDSSSGIYGGTNAGATFAAGTVGSQAAQFNGTSQSASVPRSIGGNDFTISFWMKTTATGSTGQWWAGKGLVDAEVGGAQSDFGTALLGNKVGFGIGNPDVTITSTSAVNNGAWHHVAATWSLGSGAMKLYVDGVLEASGTGARGARTSPAALKLGAIQGGGGFFQGSLDDVRLYGAILSPADIASLANPGSTPPLTGLAWDADGVSGGASGGSGIWNTSSTLWDDAGIMRNWNNANNDAAVFSGIAGAVNLATGITAAGLSFDNSYALSGAGALTLTGAQTITTASSADTLTMSTSILGGTLNKTGSGKVVLDAANTLGTVNVAAGRLELAGDQTKNRLSPGALVTVSAGAVVDYKNTNATPSESFAASPSFVLNGGTLTASGGNHGHLANLTLNGGTLTSGAAAGDYDWERWRIWGDVSVGGSSASTISGKGVGLVGSRIFSVADVTGSAASDLTVSVELNDAEATAGGLIKDGPGTMTLTRNNAYSGGTTILGGVLDLTGGGGVEGAIIGNCTVATSASLRLSVADVTGYTGTGRRLSILNLDGGNLNVNTTGNQTLGGTVLNLNGGSITGIAGSNIDFFQGNPAGAAPAALNSLASDSPSTISTVRLNIRQEDGLTISTEDGAALADLEISSVIKQGGAYPLAPLVKAGAGRLVLTGLNTFTAPTLVNEGSLALSGAATLPSSDVIVADGARFEVSGLSSGGFTIAAGKSISAGRSSAPDTDVLGSLAIDGGTLDIAGAAPLAGTFTVGGNLALHDASVNVDLANNPVTGGGVNDFITVNGNLDLSGVNEFAVTKLDARIAAGTYTLVTCTGTLTGGAANLALSGVTATTRQSFVLTTAGKSVVLQVTGQPADLVWKGHHPLHPTFWDQQTTVNWIGMDGKFNNTDLVLFDDSATGFTVDLQASMAPASVTVDNSSAYHFIGAGGIGGPTGLTKVGSGTLSVDCANTFTGSVEIQGGRLEVASVANVGQPSPLGAGPAVYLGSGTLAYTGLADDVTNRPLRLDAMDGMIEITAAGITLDQAGALSGSGALVKGGPGALMLTVANTHAGGTFVTAGTLIADGNQSRNRLPANYAATVLGGVFEIRGTNPLPDGVGIGSFTVQSGGILRVVSGGSGKIGANGESHSHLGHLTLAGGSIDMTYSGAGTAYNGESFALDGDIEVTGSAMSKIQSATTTALSGMALQGNRSFTVPDVAAGTDLLVSAQTQGPGSLTKEGLGTLELAGTHTYAGITQINAGDLKMTAAILTLSAVKVAAGAMIDGTGTVTGALEVNGTIAPGSGIGSLSAGGARIAGSYACQVSGGASDSVAVGGDLDLSGATLAVTTLAGGFTQPHYVIATYGTLIGTFASVTPGYTVKYGKGAGFNEIWLEKLAGGYNDWAAANAGGQSSDLDFDHDGVANGIEYFMGATGIGFTANPGVAADRSVTWPRDPAATVSSFKVQVSSDLGTWTDIVPDDPSLVVTSTSVTYTLPAPAGPGPKFCRLLIEP